MEKTRKKTENTAVEGNGRKQIGSRAASKPISDQYKRPWPQRIAASKHGMVSTQHHEATRAGVEILSEGGNAIDAAVAAAFALGVAEPGASGLGGQTMMLVHLAEPRRTFALDGSSRAPNRATMEEFKERQTRLVGHRATTIPSTPAVLAYTLNQHGTMSLSRVLEPAIRIAEQGYIISELQNRLQNKKLDHLKKGTASDNFLLNGKKPYPVGSLFKQPELAQTYRTLSKKGFEDFYTGDIAKQIENDMINHEGFIRRDDLAHIPYPIERRPISGRFQNMRVMTFAPPGAGRTLIEMLNILEQFTPKQYNPDTLKGALLLVEAIRRAQLDRRDRPFDPSFYPQIQDRRMLSLDYAKLMAKKIGARIKKRPGETTHLSVMDNMGNVVALTQSIEQIFGAGVVTPGLGFLYNNYMSAFDYRDITHPYYLRPNGVPWASVAPSIIFRGPRPYIAIGSPGSERITSSIMQVLVRLGYQSPLDAITAPRLHCSYNGEVWLETSRIRTDIPYALENRGFTIKEMGPFSFYMGCVQLVMRDRDRFIGAADPRRDCSAGGPLAIKGQRDSP